MKKILMVYPKIPDTYWSFKHTLPIIGKKAVIPPLGLMTVASLLPEDYEVRLVDMNVEELDENDIRDSHMVFLSAMIIQKDSFENVVSICNRLGVPVAAGGPYPSSSFEKIEGVDHFILNEAEVTLADFLADLEMGKPGRIYRSDMKPSLEETPLPRFDIIDYQKYTNMALQYSRGCPFSCEFCDIIEMFGRKPRTKSPAQFLAELEGVYDTGFRGSLFIVDDNFIGHKRKVKELLREIIGWQKEKDFPFTFFTEASIDVAWDDELLELMVDAGFDMIFTGIETPDTEGLAHIGKEQNLRRSLLESVKKIQASGLEVTAGFIVGFDTDREDIFRRQVDFIEEAGIPVAMVGILTALPNTQLYRRLEKEGRLLPEKTYGNNTHELRLNFLPAMDQETLIEGYNGIISEIYSPKKYFERCFNLIKRFPDRNRSGGGVSLQQLKYFFNSLKKQAFSWYGKLYLKFLIKVFLKKPSRFVDAVTLAVKGHHFFCLTDDIMKSVSFSDEIGRAIQRLKEYIRNIDIRRGADAAAELKSYIQVLQAGIMSKYRNLGNEVQKYHKNALDEFTGYCRNVIAQYVVQYIHESEI